jgi:hypothetical protein
MDATGHRAAANQPRPTGENRAAGHAAKTAGRAITGVEGNAGRDGGERRQVKPFFAVLAPPVRKVPNATPAPRPPAARSPARPRPAPAAPQLQLRSLAGANRFLSASPNAPIVLQLFAQKPPSPNAPSPCPVDARSPVQASTDTPSCERPSYRTLGPSSTIRIFLGSSQQVPRVRLPDFPEYSANSGIHAKATRRSGHNSPAKERRLCGGPIPSGTPTSRSLMWSRWSTSMSEVIENR